ncbi:MAG TPA: class I SAM-dependent methyltransferase [bacterium]|nr:class I SAM-dependent methyltransferase [bacterium]
MGPLVLSEKLDLLREVLRPISLQDKRVLDAGTGRTSARALLEKEPSEIVLVAAPGDERKAKPAREALAQFPNTKGNVILGDLSNSGLSPPDSFDFALADYLIGEIDCFAPSMQFPILANIYNWLRPGGELLIVDIEPPAVNKVGVLSLMQEFVFWAQMTSVLARRWKDRPRDYKAELVSTWLKGIGFADIRTDYYERRLDVEYADGIHKMAVERLSGLRNESIREGLRHQLDAALSAIRDLPASRWINMTQTNYSIRAVKRDG